jgi:alkyl hydroperoxide reductase subunit AhpF
MALITDRDRETIRRLFEEQLTGDVRITMFTETPSPIIIPGREQCETCEETQALLGEVASLSDKVDLTVHEISLAQDEAAEWGIDRVPAFVVTGAGKGHVRFFGIPSGYEFTAFIQDMIDVSRGETDLSEETREFLHSLDQDVTIKVFTTPT